MNSSEVRQKFLDFFHSKKHRIVQSAPIVIKNDPTLMFTNAGMNQFKDYFLGNKTAEDKRVANSQKCLRVSGKHNDLEEVGVDTYHHTMFEMLGNWSFGNYFKKEAIEWAWELLTEVYQLDVNRIYVTVFEGSKDDQLEYDQESYEQWSNFMEKERILRGSKKDNFWEMGETGPCGPCSEIHYDLRPDLERFALDAKTLVNNDHPQVIEIWNLVFMEFNRKSDGSLEPLPDKHVDTGMGFERLVRAIHGKQSNYDTDIFQDSIAELQRLSGKHYGEDENTDIAFRVIADHIRAISFAIADGQLPSNTGAGYVIRRILRRAIRYGYSALGFKEPEIYKLVASLALKFEKVFPELFEQKDFVGKVIQEEERSFLKTLSIGLGHLDDYFQNGKMPGFEMNTWWSDPDFVRNKKSEIEDNRNKGKTMEGKWAFYFYDTLGFPIDLTRLIANDYGYLVDEKGFEAELLKQKTRSRKDAEKSTGDWNILIETEDVEFVGYDSLEATIEIVRLRTLEAKGEKKYQAVFSLTPFYAESGGQVGDTGVLRGKNNNEIIHVLNTAKENNLIIHTIDKLPVDPGQDFEAKVDNTRRQNINRNHSGTHLLHAALKQVLGKHIAQKGSLVDEDRLRFDFSHFAKISELELKNVSAMVKQKITESIDLQEKRNIPIENALAMGATALFGEKYGDSVRVIIFDPEFSMELCGGTHVKNTSDIGAMIITAETAVAAGVRRIEAITGPAANAFIRERMEMLEAIQSRFSNPPDVLKSIEQILTENHDLKKQMENYELEKTLILKNSLKEKIARVNDSNILVETISIASADLLKDLCFQLKNEVENLFAVFGCVIHDKPFLAIIISESLVKEKGWNAGHLIREWAKEIDGGGGGQAFFATAGGKNKEGLDRALAIARKFAGF